MYLFSSLIGLDLRRPENEKMGVEDVEMANK